jgi:hypothetical protein
MAFKPKDKYRFNVVVIFFSSLNKKLREKLIAHFLYDTDRVENDASINFSLPQKSVYRVVA